MSLLRRRGRKPGSLAEVLALLAVLDFLTACDAGYSSTATRVVTLKAAQQECLAKAELQLIFGVPDADPVRTTAVMRLLQSQGATESPTSNVNFTIRNRVPILKFRRTSPGQQYYKQY